jgi:hypothetical protein
MKEEHTIKRISKNPLQTRIFSIDTKPLKLLKNDHKIGYSTNIPPCFMVGELNGYFRT